MASSDDDDDYCPAEIVSTKATGPKQPERRPSGQMGSAARSSDALEADTSTPATNVRVETHGIVRVAVQGCSHGELDRIYHDVRRITPPVDLLICCGDFQAVRDDVDLESMAVPEKYKKMGDFRDYYMGRKRAPVLTVFIGGNHEASNHLFEHYYGGFVAPNIYYLGHSGVVVYRRQLVIAGVSGIFKEQDHYKPYPLPPYDSPGLRISAYHTRHFELQKMKVFGMTSAAVAMQEWKRRPTANCKLAPDATAAVMQRYANVDVFVSHDWPNGIVHHGDVRGLLRVKPYFREDIDQGALGNPGTYELMTAPQLPSAPAPARSNKKNSSVAAMLSMLSGDDNSNAASGGESEGQCGPSYVVWDGDRPALLPRYYFAGHLHCRFAAEIKRGGAAEEEEEGGTSLKPTSGGAPLDNTDDEGCSWMDDYGADDAIQANTLAATGNNTSANFDAPPRYCSTRFLALDKCMHNNDLTGRVHLESVDIAPAAIHVDPVAASMGAAPPDGTLLEHHPLWLEVVRRTHSLLQVMGRGASPVGGAAMGSTNAAVDMAKAIVNDVDGGVDLRRSIPCTTTRELLEALNLPSMPDKHSVGRQQQHQQQRFQQPRHHGVGSSPGVVGGPINITVAGTHVAAPSESSIQVAAAAAAALSVGQHPVAQGGVRISNPAWGPTVHQDPRMQQSGGRPPYRSYGQDNPAGPSWRGRDDNHRGKRLRGGESSGRLSNQAPPTRTEVTEDALPAELEVVEDLEFGECTCGKVKCICGL